MDSSRHPSHPFDELKTAEDFHLYYVFKDKDFRKAVFELESLSELAMRNSNETHLNGLPRLDERYFEPLAAQARAIEDEYCIPRGSIDYFTQFIDDNGRISPKIEENMGQVVFDVADKSGLIKLELQPYITEAQFIKLWEQVESAKHYLKAKPRRRTANDPELVYAIFKARMKKKPYSEIFELFSQSQLPHYTKKHVQINTKESLKKYYARYRPLTNS